MITDIKLWDAQKITYVTLDDLVYPLQKFEWAYPISGDDQPKPFSYGKHNSRKTIGSMTLDLEGECHGSTTSDYWTKRKAIANCVLPKKSQTVYRHSFIEVTLDDSTTYHADLQLTSYAMPLAATGAPTLSPMMFAWEVNIGYWLDSVGNEAYL